MRMKVDKWPKNGKTSATPKVPSPTFSAKPTVHDGQHIPEQGKRATPKGQYSDGGTKGAPKEDKGTMAAHSPGTGKSTMGENHPKGSRVPGDEHHSAGHREPRSHDEFHKLGVPKDGSY